MNDENEGENDIDIIQLAEYIFGPEREQIKMAVGYVFPYFVEKLPSKGPIFDKLMAAELTCRVDKSILAPRYDLGKIDLNSFTICGKDVGTVFSRDSEIGKDINAMIKVSEIRTPSQRQKVLESIKNLDGKETDNHADIMEEPEA